MNVHQFQLGAEIHGNDKSLGHLRKIAVEPNNWQVTHLIVEWGMLFKHAKAILASYVERSTVDGIYLSLNADELERFDDYEETVVSRELPATDNPPSGYGPVSQGTAVVGSAELPHVAPYTPRTDLPGMSTVQEKVHLGVSEEDIILDEETVVGSKSEEFGRLNGITAEADSLFLSTVIAAQGQMIARPFQVSSSLVKTLSDERIEVALNREQLEELLAQTDLWEEDEPRTVDRRP